MANKTQSNSFPWENTSLDLEKTFEEGDFATLITYADENKLQLLSTLLNEDLRALDFSLRFGSCVLSYFESCIKKDAEKTAAFKLGELKGYVGLLESIKYEQSQNQWAETRFEKVQSKLPNYKNLLKDIIMALFEKVGIEEQELSSKFSICSLELQEIMQVLEEYGLVYNYNNSIGGYTLTDMGLRLARIVKKGNEDISKS